MSSVFSIELDGISNACRANVMMNSPVTITMAMEAMNSGVVSLGFAGLCASASSCASAAFWAFCGALFTEFLVPAKCVLPWESSDCLPGQFTARSATCGATAGFRPGWLHCAPDSKVYQTAVHQRRRQCPDPSTSKSTADGQQYSRQERSPNS